MQPLQVFSSNNPYLIMAYFISRICFTSQAIVASKLFFKDHRILSLGGGSLRLKNIIKYTISTIIYEIVTEILYS
jgi:hypothetical protein